MTQQPYDDPFAKPESAPSLSFKDAPVGTRYVCKVVDLPQRVQSRDFETGERATWPDGNPRMSVVTGVEVDGERRSLWAPDPSAMFAAIVDAQRNANARIAVGGTLVVEYIGDKPNEKNPKLNPQKQYRVTYSAPDAFAAQQPTQSAQQYAPTSQGGYQPAQQYGQPSAEPPF